jgi:tight adherence protein C
VPIDPGKLREVVDPPPPASTPTSSDPLPWYAGYADYAAAFLGSLGIVALFAGTSMRFTRGPMESRLTAFVESTRPSRARQKKSSSGSRALIGAARSVSNRVSRFLPARRIEMMREQLSLAGNPYGWGVEEFLGIRTILGIVLGGYVYVILLRNGPFQALLFGGGVAALGFLLPSIWMGRKIKARQKAVFRAMPNALDLLCVSVEAGLGFDQAIAEVCNKWRNALTEEFDILLAELRMGRTRREALKGLMERTGVPELGAFASALIQADELGASIARTLTVQAEQIRIRRRQKAEEAARQAGIKMLFPLVFLMLPALFVVILGPSVPLFQEAFGQIGK